MRKKRKFLCNLLCVILSAAVMLPMGLTRGEKATKQTPQRVIAVVFDNSASMYSQKNENGTEKPLNIWCRAIYGMEVFAAMMNEGDIMEIYPMHPITVEKDGAEYDETNPLVIDSSDKVKMIRNIYTPSAGNTPVETITAAYNGLQKYSNDKEKWLVVLTDGATFYKNKKPLNKAETREVLNNDLSEYNRNVNIQFLGIGENTVEVEINGSCLHYVFKAEDSVDVLKNLTEMCNLIFGRDELSRSKLSMSFDLPMSKLIIFAQGANVGNISISNSAGGSSGEAKAEFAAHYGEKGAGNRKFALDEDLQGAIKTYENCPAGSYTISCDGTPGDICVYYEPDVDLAVYLADENGNPVLGDVVSGTYYIQYGLTDKDGNFISSSLLGETNFEITYTYNGEEKSEHFDKNGKIKITVKAGDTLDVHAVATYLGGYRIERNGSELGWPTGGYKVFPKPAGSLKINLSGGRESYKLSQLEEDGIYFVNLIYEGNALTGAALDNANIDVCVSAEGGEENKVSADPEKTAEGFRIKLHYAEPLENTQCGEYTLKISAFYVNEEGQTANSNIIQKRFTLEDDSSSLQMEVDAPQTYYQISKIAKGKPITVHITENGEPLTDEELAKVNLTVNPENFPIKYEMQPGESAFKVWLDPDGEFTPGLYKLSFNASYENPSGFCFNAEQSKQIELSRLPKCFWWLIAFLIIALLAIIIFLIMRHKVLPRGIVYGNPVDFRVNGEQVAGIPNYRYNRKYHSLELGIPNFPADFLINGSGFRLQLEPVSHRWTKSSARRAGIKTVTGINFTVNELSLGGVIYTKNPENPTGNTFVKIVGAEMQPIGNNTICTISGETPAGDTFNCSYRLLFR